MVGGSKPRPYPPFEIIPLNDLQATFPEFDVKEGDVVRRDGKLVRVNSTGLQVELDPKIWSFDSNTGEFYGLRKAVDGYKMVSPRAFSTRVAEAQKTRALHYSWLFSVLVAVVLYAAVFIPLGVWLYNRGYIIAGVLSAGSMIFFVVVIAPATIRRITKTLSPEYLLGPEPLLHRVSGFGEQINTPPAAPSSASDSYQIPT